jgi:hypothetical protein
MAQVLNDPGEPPPAIGSKLHLSFEPDNAIVLADAVVRGRA